MEGWRPDPLQPPHGGPTAGGSGQPASRPFTADHPTQVSSQHTRRVAAWSATAASWPAYSRWWRSARPPSLYGSSSYTGELTTQWEGGGLVRYSRFMTGLQQVAAVRQPAVPLRQLILHG
jgi:hypothetical protein